MPRASAVAVAEVASHRPRRSFTTMAAFVFGVPMTVAVLTFIHRGPLRQTEAPRYVRHPAEVVEVLLFCCALGALLTKVAGSLLQRRFFRRPPLADWDGQPVPAQQAGELLGEVCRHGRAWRHSLLGRRVTAVLDFVRSRGSANELDDQMRALADNDALALEGSYALVRFITWAIPILGFLGTVMGITKAIAGVTPEVLEHSLSQVTDGLAEAFDTTALGLALTMLTMFLSFLAERLEEGLLLAVDAYADRHLAHRFGRAPADEAGLAGEVRRSSEALLAATGQLVERQARLWSETVREAQQQWTATGSQQQALLTAALEQALERFAAGHARRLAEWEEQNASRAVALAEKLGRALTSFEQGAGAQQAALAELSARLAAQTEALARLDAGTAQLLRLEEALSHNLSVLAGAGAFEQAVSSLTAAIHLLTTRLAASPAPASAARRPGAAA